MRKKGINNELPIKSIRFIKMELWGINLFRTKPATKAPIICSTPATYAKKAEKKIMDNTKIYCELFSLSSLLKNQRAIFGIIINMIKEKMVNEVPNLSQNEKSKSPFVELEIMARMINTAVSVSMVPPTAMATAGCFDKPNLLITG